MAGGKTLPLSPIRPVALFVPASAAGRRRLSLLAGVAADFSEKNAARISFAFSMGFLRVTR